MDIIFVSKLDLIGSVKLVDEPSSLST